jgi:hypothetical protein
VGDPTEEFFDQLSRRGHDDALGGVTGTIRFDLRGQAGIDQWFLYVKDGNVEVARQGPPTADCVIHTDRAVFDQLATGQLHPMPAWLRNLFWLEGDASYFRVFNRIFPGPPQARDPRDLVSHGRRGR